MALLDYEKDYPVIDDFCSSKKVGPVDHQALKLWHRSQAILTNLQIDEFSEPRSSNRIDRAKRWAELLTNLTPYAKALEKLQHDLDYRQRISTLYDAQVKPLLEGSRQTEIKS